MLFNLVCIVVIFVTSLSACLFPVLQGFPATCVYVARHFGTGVIIATALMHLLEPASDALGSETLPGAWDSYPFAYLFCLLGLLITVLGDVFSRRYLGSTGVSHDHGSSLSIKAEHKSSDEISNTQPLSVQISGLLVLEVGIVLHSLFIGLSLATSGDDGVALAIAIVFHQFFEGLGLGARLSSVKWPRKQAKVPALLALLYAMTTPFGILIGMLVSSSYDADSTTALLATGICDALSAGILLYTGLVELLANEVVNAEDLGTAPKKDILIAFSSIVGGCIAMAVLAIWI